MRGKIVASAPGKVILFGEHAVVYGKLGIVSAIDKRCYTSLTPLEGNQLKLILENYKLERELSRASLKEFYLKTKTLVDSGSFSALTSLTADVFAPLCFVLGYLVTKHEFKGCELRIRSEVKKGLGSSSACFASVAIAYSEYLGLSYAPSDVERLAYLGDILAHGGTPSGIDNAVVTHGGFLTFRKASGAERFEIGYVPKLVIIDSGTPAKTSETVAHIRELRESEPELVNSIMEDLESIAERALVALKERDLEALGKEMIAYYTTLSRLGISTSKLDEAVELALKLGALGAKPTGGWGGGCCIALARDEEHAKELARSIKNSGFEAFTVSLGAPGARLELKTV